MTLYMYWPQVIWAVMVLLGLGIQLARHGQTRTGKHSFWWQLFGSATVALLLWSGGFFSQTRAAQPPQASLQYRADVIRNARLEWGMSAPVADFAAQLHQESVWPCRTGWTVPAGLSMSPR